MNINDKMSAFMEKHFAAQLQAEGFVSYRNNMRHWYKLVDESVLQTVILDYFSNDKGILNFWYGSVPLYVPLPFPYQHSTDLSPYEDILEDAYANYWCKKRCPLYYDPLGRVGRTHYDKVVQIFQAAMREYILPSFALIHDLGSCHSVWWEEEQRRIACALSSAEHNDRSPYYSDTRGIWELIYGHHKEELADHIRSNYASRCQFWGDCIHDTRLPESWRVLQKVYYECAKRIIHDAETDNWDDLDLILQENMQQMRELVRKKLKL